MMNAGLLDEVKSVLQFRHLSSMNTVGYKELFNYLDGNCSLGGSHRNDQTEFPTLRETTNHLAEAKS